MSQEPENTQRLRTTAAGRSAADAFRWWLCGVCVLLVIVAVALPSSALSWLRRDFEMIGVPLQWLDHASRSLPFDLTHVVLFGLVAFVMVTLWPRARWWQIGSALVMLAVGSELLQFLVPGREPRLSDVFDDLIGAGIGCLLALPIRWLAR